MNKVAIERKVASVFRNMARLELVLGKGRVVDIPDTPESNQWTLPDKW